MSHRGFSHIGLSTLDLDKTREFYEDLLGFKPVVCDTIEIEEGGKDPNGLSLEYCCLIREFTADDAHMQDRFKLPLQALNDPVNTLQSPDKH